MRARTWGALVAVIWFLATPLAAQAQQPDDRALAREHYVKGTKAFELGAYDEAIVEYAAAYRLRDDPALLYNLGQAHRLAGHAVDASRFYRLYLQKIPNAPNADEVREKVVELQKLIDQQKRTQSLPPDQVRPLGSSPAPREPATATEPSPRVPSPPPPVPPTATAANPPETTAAAATEKPTDANPATTTEHPGRTKIVAGLAVAGVGIGALAGGIACGVLAQNAGQDLSRLDQMMQAFDASKESTGKTDQLVSGVLIGVGAAAIVAGGVVFAVGYRERAHATNHAALPASHGRVASAQVSR